MTGRTPEQVLAELETELLRGVEATRPRRGRAAAISVIAVGCLALAFTLVARPTTNEIEAVATGTPKPRATWPPTIPAPAPDSDPKILTVRALDPVSLAGDRSVIDDLAGTGAGATLERAWAASDLKGAVHLSRLGSERWCLSVPDSATAAPDLERGKACVSDWQFQQGGVDVVLGDSLIAVTPEGARAPELRRSDGKRTQLQAGDGGLLIATKLPANSTVKFFDVAGKARTLKFKQTVDWTCPDGRRGFRFPVDAIPADDPC